MADTETVTVLRPPGKNAVGDPLPGTPVETDLPGCLFAPGTSIESGQGTGADQVDTHATIYRIGDSDVQVRPTDQIRARGVLYEVVGEPQVWVGFGMVINLRRTTG